MTLDLLRTRVAFVTLAQPSVAYCRAHGIDFLAVEPHAGGPFLGPITTDRTWFDFDPAGDEAVIVEARGADPTEVVDLVAWFANDPSTWWTAIGNAVALGESAAVNPASHAFGPFRMYRTPERWLQSECDGACILNPALGGRWLLDVPASRIAAEDEAHAAELDAMRRSVLREQRILVPTARVA